MRLFIVLLTVKNPAKICYNLRMDLFDTAQKREPLAARMRPRNLDEYIGQSHIVGKGRLLRRAIQADRLSSVIFYGPPGTGKTTLARVIANHTKSNFLTLNAVLTGVSDIREAIKNADDFLRLYGKKSILFVDEVHRWNKGQQDALLPWVENGTIILIGATTENPFFEVNRALVSRSRVFQLKSLTFDELLQTAHFALNDRERGYGKWRVVFENGALEHLVESANGDARSLLNALELAVETTPDVWPPKEDFEIFISKEVAEESIQKKVVLYDRDGDYHYDIISAFIKSIRGRDADAALYWLARMIHAGEDPHFIFRRMLISACEDTGLADPNAIVVVENCARAFDRIGLPEGRYHLAHAALYLATAPKSNSSMAFFDALSAVEKENADVPNHLKDPSRDSQGFNHGDGYLYPHAYRDHWVAQQYLPDALVGRIFYTPTNQGYESKIREDVLKRREIQIASILQNENEKNQSDENFLSEWWIQKNFKIGTKTEENLTFSPENKEKTNAISKAEKIWRSRLESNRAQIFSRLRDALIEIADVKRHTRSLVWNADNGLLLWELLRKSAEGIVCGACRTKNGQQILEKYAQTIDDLEKPIFAHSFDDVFSSVKYFFENQIEFDKIFLCDPFSSVEMAQNFADSLSKIDFLQTFPTVIFSQRIPKNGQRLSELVQKQIFCGIVPKSFEDDFKKIQKSENEFFENEKLFSWDGKSLADIFEQRGFFVTHAAQDFTEKRKITPTEIERWFDAEKSAYACALRDGAGKDALLFFKNVLLEKCADRLFLWHGEIEFFKIEQRV